MNTTVRAILATAVLAVGVAPAAVASSVPTVKLTVLDAANGKTATLAERHKIAEAVKHGVSAQSSFRYIAGATVAKDSVKIPVNGVAAKVVDDHLGKVAISAVSATREGDATLVRIGYPSPASHVEISLKQGEVAVIGNADSLLVVSAK